VKDFDGIIFHRVVQFHGSGSDQPARAAVDLLSIVDEFHLSLKHDKPVFCQWRCQALTVHNFITCPILAGWKTQRVRQVIEAGCSNAIPRSCVRISGVKIQGHDRKEDTTELQMHRGVN
jgi:hypothetical protein